MDRCGAIDRRFQHQVRHVRPVSPLHLRGAVRSYCERIQSAKQSNRGSRFFECNQLKHELRALLKRSLRTATEVRDALGSKPADAQSLMSKDYVVPALNATGQRAMATGAASSSPVAAGARPAGRTAAYCCLFF
jgi:hypothetical protein